MDNNVGITIDEIEGLGPVKATLITSSFAGQDGEQHHSSRRESRNIKFKLGLEPDEAVESVQDLRNRIYSFFMPKSEVNMTFYQHDGFRHVIRGVVETCEPPMFTEEPGVDVSLMCFKPDFLDPNPKTINGLSTQLVSYTPIIYDGTVETGIVFKLKPDRDINGFTIYHVGPNNIQRQLDFTLPLLNNDELTISTVRGSKFAILKRAGVETSVVHGVTPQSKWIELEQGGNEIRVYVSGTGVPWELTRTDRYGGL